MALEGVLSDIVSVFSTKDALQEGYLTKTTFRWLPVTTEAKGNYQKQYKAGIVENEERNQMIAELCNKTHKNDNVIVLVKQVSHLKILADLIPTAITITGKEKDEERRYIMDQFRKGHINILIGTSVIGEGVDLPNANVLICAAGGKSKIQVMQNVGRVMRLSPGKEESIVYDFIDASSYLSQHSDARNQIYMEEYSAPDKNK
jgi:superfamily II DNA or RNA helicase